jgi:peptidoglycan/xylan/chitin deacetylase (PgdA/CDA1 family)
MRVVAAGALVATTSLVAFAATHSSWRIGPVAAPAAPLPAAAEPAPAAPRKPVASPVTEVSPDVAVPAREASPPARDVPAPSREATVPTGEAPAPAREAATPAPEAAKPPVRMAAGPTPAPAAAAPAPAPAPAAAAAPACPGNPNALGVTRTVEIDTTGGPGFGFEHFKAYDFLKVNEVVLTFDDGPWPNNTAAVLAALASHCTKAVFFPIGQHAIWHPEILKEVAAAGHTIGSHTWSHQDLSNLKALAKRNTTGKDEIEKGISAVHTALGDTPFAPFFRFPALRQPQDLQEYLGQRNIAMWSTDMDSFDFKLRRPQQVIESVMNKLRKHGKGIVLMHDFQRHTAEALPELLRQMQAAGYKIVQVKAKEPVKTLANYDAMMAQEIKGGGGGGRPISSVVRTIDTYADTPPAEKPK